MLIGIELFCSIDFLVAQNKESVWSQSLSFSAKIDESKKPFLCPKKGTAFFVVNNCSVFEVLTFCHLYVCDLKKGFTLNAVSQRGSFLSTPFNFIV